MNIEVESSTDTPAQVLAAMGKTKKPAPVAAPTADQTAVETPVESEPTETETEVNAGGSDSASETEVETEGDESADKTAEEIKTGKRKSGVKRLREKLSAKDQQIGYLQSELDKARNAGGTKVETTQAKAVTDDARPIKDKFDTHDEYVEALTDWKVDQKLKAEKAQAFESSVKSESQKKAETHYGRVQEFAKANPDFADVVADLDDGPKVSLTVQECILNSENGPELMYQLAKNRKEFERINALSPLAAAREIGKFESKFAKPSAEITETKTTRAPAPVKPVGSKSSVSTKDPEKMEFDEFRQWREKQLSKGA